MRGFGEASGGAAVGDDRTVGGADKVGENPIGPLGVDLFEGFFTKFGSPESPLCGEKPLELINRQPANAESAVLVDVGNWARGGHQPGMTRPSAARAKKPAQRRGKAVIDVGLRDQLCLLLSLGYSRRRAATALEIDQSTISRSLKRDAELAESVRRAEERWLQRRGA